MQIYDCPALTVDQFTSAVFQYKEMPVPATTLLVLP